MSVVHVLGNGLRVGGAVFDSHLILEVAIFATGPGCMGLA